MSNIIFVRHHQTHNTIKQMAAQEQVTTIMSKELDKVRGLFFWTWIRKCIPKLLLT